ncbi:MAG: right-handed parallel beta-helix repeat-containing protein [Polyangiaceae bacterium]
MDWKNIDRLYVPAGIYKSFQLGNLPTRDAKKPLVITNIGGQVQVGPNDPGGNFIWSMSGGSNWVLTGRFDPTSKTGDENIVGHRCGAYAASRGKYGFLSDDAYAVGQYSHMGIAVSDATQFEIEYVEVTRSGFAGIRLLNSRAAGDPARPMENVRVHDTYIHDIGSEGYYFGWTGDPPSNLFPGLQVYNNRIIRTGSETLQVQDLGEGTHIHHNVFAFGALHWLDNFGNYQDNGTQVLVRSGTVEIDHNIVQGGAGTLLSFFSSPEPGDGDRKVTFHDNYFADTRSLGAYLNGTSEGASSFTFRGNFFRGLDFGYKTVNPSASDPGVVFGINQAHKAPILLEGNTFEGPRALLAGVQLNGTKANITATGNVNASVPPVTYVASGYPNVRLPVEESLRSGGRPRRWRQGSRPSNTRWATWCSTTSTSIKRPRPIRTRFRQNTPSRGRSLHDLLTTSVRLPGRPTLPSACGERTADGFSTS